jgi:hypothetical protein
MANDHPATPELEPREPTLDDLVALCRQLNDRGAAYLVIGGFAMRAVGYVRQTLDVDLLIAGDPDNERRVYEALGSLPDRAAAELMPGELARYAVIRVADEIVVDLMKSAGGVEYAATAPERVIININGVAIPFASARLLWRMKATTHRAKDEPDLLFLRQWFSARGEQPPAGGA